MQAEQTRVVFTSGGDAEMLEGWQAPDVGVLFVISGASGTGKSTLLSRIFEEVPGLEFAVSATTRAPRAGEKDGREYHFMDRDHFRALLAENALLEHAEVYGNYYGTPRAQVEKALGEGRSIVLDIDTHGAAQVRKSKPEAVFIFILPPDVETLQERLTARGQDQPEVIARRVREARLQLTHCGEYDYLVMNDVLETAVACLKGILLAEMCRRGRRGRWVEKFVL